MPLVGPERDGERADVAVKRIGLLQNEAEMPRTPGFDLFPFLAGRPQWDVELFTERTFGGIGSPSRIDALVVGYNSLYLSKAAREAFEADPPTSHLVVLHQLGPDCLAFLRGDLSIKLRSVPGDLVTGAWLPKERSREREVALSWPAKVAPHPAAERREATAEAPPAGASGADDPAEPDVELVSAPAIRYLDFEPGGAWRVVLEARVGTARGHRRLPVVVRTADFVPQRVVVCTLLLESERDAGLIENLVTYAATGWPDVAVVDTDPEHDDEDEEADHPYRAGRITERLRLQGARAIRVPVADPGTLEVGAWPLTGVGRIVVPDSIDYAVVRGSADGEDWLRRGGTLVRASADGLTIHTGITDSHWVARRWAAWFNSTRPDRWQGSLFATRAVLRMLVRLKEVSDYRGDLGVAIDPDAFHAPAARLLAARLRGGNAENTVGATAAGWDIAELVGPGALNRRVRAKTEEWLRARGDDEAVSAEDRLDIARSLADGAMAAAAIGAAAEGPPSAALAIRVREAILACATYEDGRPVDLPELPDGLVKALNGARVVEELRASRLLSAEFVDVYHRFRHAAPEHRLAGIPHEVRDAAVTAMAGLRGLAQDSGLERSEPYDISVEAHALLAYVEHESISAFRVRPEARELPAGAVDAVLAETLAARTREQEAARRAGALGNTVHVLGALSLVAAGVVLGAVLRFFSVRLGTLASALAAGGIVVVGLVLALVRSKLLPRLGPRERHEIWLAQVVLGILVVGTAAGLAAAAIRTVGGALAVIVILTAAAAGAGLVFLGLKRVDLAPTWVPRVLQLVIDPKELLGWVRERAGKPREPS